MDRGMEQPFDLGLADATAAARLLRDELSAKIETAAAEARLAGLSLAAMAALGAAAGASVLMAYAALLGIAVFAAIGAGASVEFVLAAVAAAQLLVAAYAWRRAKRLARHLDFRRIRGSFAPNDAGGR